jgi:hypothetical protein
VRFLFPFFARRFLFFRFAFDLVLKAMRQPAARNFVLRWPAAPRTPVRNRFGVRGVVLGQSISKQFAQTTACPPRSE